MRSAWTYLHIGSVSTWETGIETALMLQAACHNGDGDSCPTCMEKLQSTINYAFKLCGGIGLFFSFTEVTQILIYKESGNCSCHMWYFMHCGLNCSFFKPMYGLSRVNSGALNKKFNLVLWSFHMCQIRHQS